MKILTSHDYQNNEIQNAKLQPVGSDPSSLASNNAGRVWFNTGAALLKVWNGAAADTLTNLVESVASADGALSVGLANKIATITAAAASASQRGTMSTTHFTLVNNATSANNPSTLVARDGSGNISVGTVTGSLSGTASNASALGGASLTQVRDFSQTTGQRTATSAISDFDTQVRTSRLDQLQPPTSTLNANGQRFGSLADPVNPQDAATKNYADNLAAGLDAKASVRLATAAALPSNTRSGNVLTAGANGALSVDSVAVAVGNRILVKNEATGANNGIYVVTDTGSGSTPYILTRATDADSNADVTPGLFTFVEEGSTLAASSWVLSTPAPVTVNTTALSFVQFSGGGTYINGNGLNLSGSTFSVRAGSTGSIAVSASGVDIASSYVGQTSITTLGTIGTGTWQGSPVGVAYGGTGATSAAGAKTSLGFKTGNAADIPALAANTGYTWTHGLGTTDIVPVIIEKSTGAIVVGDITNITTTQLTVTFGVAVAASAYRLVAIG